MSVRNRLSTLRTERGIGLIELLIALTVLAVGIAAVMSVFAGSILSLQHASKEGTAITLADRQLEAYRSMPWSCIPTSFPSSPPSGCLTFTGFPNPYAATQTTTSSDSPDHRTYTVTTAIATASGSTSQITVNVALSSGGPTLAQESSYFSSAGTSANG